MRGNWRDLRPAAILLVISVLGSVVAGSLPRAGDTRFAVIAPPWYGLAEAVELVGRAGGAVVDAGGLPNVIIAQSKNSGFVGALYRQGAWLVDASSRAWRLPRHRPQCIHPRFGKGP